MKSLEPKKQDNLKREEIAVQRDKMNVDRECVLAEINSKEKRALLESELYSDIKFRLRPIIRYKKNDLRRVSAVKRH